MGLSIVLLAAGEGKRMKTDKPKPLVSLANHPLIQYSLDTAKELKPERLVLVTGYKKDEVKKYVISKNPGDFIFCEQKERLGTGHAVKQAAPYLPDTGKTLVLYADVPLVSIKSLKKLIKSMGEKCKVSIRNIRRDANEELKKLLKSKDIGEDEEKKFEKNVQNITDKHIQIVEEKVSSKEKEIMTI